MIKTTIIVVALGLLVWFAATIVRLENESYALQLGLCGGVESGADWEAVKERYRCLDKVETRTSPLWHLLYALGGRS